MWAAERGNVRTVELLLDRGAKTAEIDKVTAMLETAIQLSFSM